jgi:twitching motility protein PilI
MSENSTLFGVIYGLAQKFGRNCRPLPAQTNFAPVTRVLCFNVLDINLAILLGELHEVLETPRYTRLPMVRPWVLGLSNVRGKLLPIIDLAGYLAGTLSSRRSFQRVLIIDIAGNEVGFLVDGVFGVRHFTAEQFDGEATIPEIGNLARCVSGCFVEKGGEKNYFFRPEQLDSDMALLDMSNA